MGHQVRFAVPSDLPSSPSLKMGGKWRWDYPGIPTASSQQPAELTSQRKGFSPECCSEWTFSDILRLKDFPQVSQVKGMSLVWAAGGHQTSLLRGTYLNPHLQTCLLAALHPALSWRVTLNSTAA